MTTLWPTLRVRDVRASLAFYSECLGFRTDFVEVDQTGVAFLASVEVGATVIMFESAGPEQTLLPSHGAQSGVSLTILLPSDADLDAMHADLARKGHTICSPLATRAWGNREFGVRDPDGYHIVLAKAIQD